VTEQRTSTPEQPLSEEDVDKTRAWTGFFVVVGGDVAIVAAVVVALFKFANATASTSNAVLASLLSSAFAAIGTMTTAYFGIRASSNTAQRSIKHPPSVPTSNPDSTGTNA
jgi:hypothetical protein